MTDTETTEETSAQTEKIIHGNDMTIAYIVGLKNDGNFLFELLGNNQGIVELMGIHQYASKRIEMHLNQRNGTGDALTLEVAKGINMILKKLSQILSIIAPNPPDNQI